MRTCANACTYSLFLYAQSRHAQWACIIKFTQQDLGQCSLFGALKRDGDFISLCVSVCTGAGVRARAAMYFCACARTISNGQSYARETAKNVYNIYMYALSRCNIIHLIFHEHPLAKTTNTTKSKKLAILFRPLYSSFALPLVIFPRNVLSSGAMHFTGRIYGHGWIR